MSSSPSSELVAHFLQNVQLDDVMTQLERVSSYDRYQASRGIEQAADLVAERAEAIGVADVSVTSFVADGTPSWWSFRAPVSWTPTVARLEIRATDGQRLEIDHARQPFSVATHSQATPPGGITARLVNVRDSPQMTDLSGAIVVLGREAFGRPELLAELARSGVIGFLADACSDAVHGLEHPARIELDADTPLFAFSLAPRLMDIVRSWADAGADARGVVDVDRSAGMPVATGVLPGERDDEEIWLTAHLCHPRPGANDNASGVAALLGVAGAHIASRRAHGDRAATRTIRFVWAPEFAGTAAMLHQSIDASGEARRPVAVLNLDMVGEDQAACGGPFVLERSPRTRPSLIDPIARDIVGSVFEQTSRNPGTWRTAPFVGSSDHALFSDPRFGCPAVQLCHSPDMFNHSAADSLDKVCEVEMLRTTAAGAAIAQILADDEVLPHAALERLVLDWCAEEDAAGRRAARRHRHVEGGDWGRRLVRNVAETNAALLSILRGEPGRRQSGATCAGAVSATWSGPINIRALLADLPASSRAGVKSLIAADRENYGFLLNCAIRADGRRSRREIIDETSFAFGHPVDEEVAATLFDALLESRWVLEETPL